MLPVKKKKKEWGKAEAASQKLKQTFNKTKTQVIVTKLNEELLMSYKVFF